jgi:hypothetical protein
VVVVVLFYFRGSVLLLNTAAPTGCLVYSPDDAELNLRRGWIDNCKENVEVLGEIASWSLYLP